MMKLNIVILFHLHCSTNDRYLTLYWSKTKRWFSPNIFASANREDTGGKTKFDFAPRLFEKTIFTLLKTKSRGQNQKTVLPPNIFASANREGYGGQRGMIFQNYSEKYFKNVNSLKILST